MPGVVCVLTGADLADIDPTTGHAISDRPIVAIDQVRFHGEPVAAVAAETTAGGRGRRRARSSVEYEELPVVGDDRATRSRRTRRSSTTAESRPGLFHGLGELAAGATGNVCYRYRHRPRRARGGLRARRHRRRGRVHLPGRLPVRDGDAHRRSPRSRATRSRSGRPASTRSSCAREIADALPGAGRERPRQSCRTSAAASARSRTRRWSRSTVALARKAGPAGAHPEPRRRVDGDDAPPRHALPDAHGDDARTAACSRRDVECRFDTGAYADNGPRVDRATAGDAAPGPYRWAAYRVDAACVYTNTAPAGSYRAFGATHLQWIGESAGRRGRPPRRARPAATSGAEPLHPGRGGARRRQAARRRPRRRRREGGRGGRLGRGEAAVVGRGRLGRPARRRRAPGLERRSCRLEADGSVVVLVGTTEMGQGAAHGLRADRRRGDRLSSRAGDGARRRHALHARTTARPARAARRRSPGSPSSARRRDVRAQLDGDRRARPRTSTPSDHLGAHAPALRLRRRRADRPRRGRADRHRLVRRGPVFWEVCVGAAEVEVDADTGRRARCCRTATAADVGRAINPQLVERQDEGATLQGIGNALFEEMVYEDGLLLNDDAARLPRADASRISRTR